MGDEEAKSMFEVPTEGELSDNLLKMMAKQETFIENHSASKNAELMHKFLGFHIAAMGLEAKGTKDQAVMRTGHSVSPMSLNVASLNPRARVELKVKSLQVLHKLVKQTKKSRTFAFWYVFLPTCPFNPCKNGALELINHPDQMVREKALDLLMEVFQSSTTHLLLANAHCRAGSFTPVCLEFALALGRMVRCAVNCFHFILRDFGQPSQVSHASRALVVLFEHVPFHRLENGLLSEVFERLLQPGSITGPRANPVILIAVLQVFAVIVSISPVHQEVKSQFKPLFDWFLSLAFPSADLKGCVDNNIRYVSIQNLGLTAVLDTGQFLCKMSTLHPLLEEAIKSEKDQSVVIHVLRLLKTIGKCGNSMESTMDAETEKRLLHFWLGVLKPSLIDSVESRDCPVLKAALCNCIAEIGTSFAGLPTDRRMLAVTLLLRLCRDQDHRSVTAATRGLGMFVSLPTLQNDVSFLNDSAEIMLEIFHRTGDKQAHQSVITSCTWALANLSDSLAKHHSQREIDDVFPPYLVLELMRVAITMAFASSNHMNVRSNSVRSLGSLLQCLNAMTKFVGLDGFQEVDELCEKAVDAIVLNIASGKVMKVRWNACYAAGGVLKTTISPHDSRFKLIQAILPVMEACPNYKVRINAALALTSVQDRPTFQDLFVPAAVAVIKSLEAAVTNVEDTEEIQHRNDLIDQLCITYAHLISISTQADITEMNARLLDQQDLIGECMRSALLRISPEKTSVFVEAKRHIHSTLNKLPTEIFPIGIIDSTIL